VATATDGVSLAAFSKFRGALKKARDEDTDMPAAAPAEPNKRRKTVRRSMTFLPHVALHVIHEFADRKSIEPARIRGVNSKAEFDSKTLRRGEAKRSPVLQSKGVRSFTEIRCRLSRRGDVSLMEKRVLG
jgi:hypothetical protein